MTASIANKDSSLEQTSSDCSAFLNWQYNPIESEDEKAVVFQSLVATIKFQPALDDSLEAKAVNFLESVDLLTRSSAHAFLNSFASNSDDSLTDFVQSIVVLVSIPNEDITTSTMKMLRTLLANCSATHRLALVKADMIPQLISILNPLSLSLVDAVDVHLHLHLIIATSLFVITPHRLGEVAFEDANQRQAVHETVLQQVVVPSEKYILHLCVNRYSIVDGDQSRYFLTLLAHILEISPSYRPTMDFVLNLPMFATISSCLTFYESDYSISSFLSSMVDIQRNWNKKGEEERHMWKKVHRKLRMEGLEDVIEEKLRNDKDEYGGWLIDNSIDWSNLLGMNLPRRQ
ncbi:hypothetical protein BLNAU_16191 [Blattamonas nauphoetae]|uniref:Uncharacterized protein n=1 Tax=Blattamonas nauphoetae TaxID=2049346 RepID=A0ABQ9X8G9_9EUKA|nr:hypothetical protein BLNAU_16191 [Blattamonas nauphoetae]